MGMPNPGIDEAVRLLDRPRGSQTKVLAAIAGTSADEVVRLAAMVEPHVDAVEVGLVCRHSPETFDMAELPTVTAILEGVGRQKSKPTFVKIPPHHTEAERLRTQAIVDVCIANGIEGVSVSGTLQISEPRLSTGEGGLAGKATTDDALRILRDVADRAAGRLAIKASGGVMDGADAMRFLEAGATAVEVYSAFIYRGPSVARRIGRELARELDRAGLASVREIHRRTEGPPAAPVAASTGRPAEVVR
jgi:dihydroorotate dehydrogenase